MENKDLYTALIKAQAEMPVALKSSANPFFKSKYADLEEIVSISQPILAKHNLGVIQKIDLEGDYHVLVTIIIHSSGQSMESKVKIMPKDNTLPQFGAAITYLRRFSYASLLRIVSDEDLDGAETHEPVKYNTEYISKDQEAELRYELADDMEYAKKILKAFNIERLAEIPRSEYRRTIEAVKSYKAKKQTINQ